MTHPMYQDWEPAEVPDHVYETGQSSDSGAKSNQCELCGRVMRKGTTQHHLIPRTCHKNRWFQKNFSRDQMRVTVPLCRDCHSAIHRFVPKEKDLGRFYHSVPLLLSHPEINRFVSWVKDRK